ncbi:TetR/AcrR family transcriptional regulator [soil metagenome]
MAKAQPKKRERLVEADRRAQLLELGLGAFGSRSYDAVSIDDLAKEAKVSKGLLYHYFPTKRAYYVAALRLAASRLLAETETLPTLAPLDRALGGLVAYLDFAERHAPAFITLMNGGIGADSEVAVVIEGTRQVFIERMLEGRAKTTGKRADAALRLMVRGFVGFVEATCIEWIGDRSVTREDLLALWMRALVGLFGPA